MMVTFLILMYMQDWLVNQSIDPINDAVITSMFLVTEDASVVVRCRDGNLDALIDFRESLESNEVMVRWDQELPREETWTASEQKNFLFYPDTREFLEHLFNHQTLTLRAELYGSGRVTVVIPLGDFRTVAGQLDIPCSDVLLPPDLPLPSPIDLLTIYPWNNNLARLNTHFPLAKSMLANDTRSFKVFHSHGWEVIEFCGDSPLEISTITFQRRYGTPVTMAQALSGMEYLINSREQQSDKGYGFLYIYPGNWPVDKVEFKKSEVDSNKITYVKYTLLPADLENHERLKKVLNINPGKKGREAAVAGLLSAFDLCAFLSDPSPEKLGNLLQVEGKSSNGQWKFEYPKGWLRIVYIPGETLHFIPGKRLPAKNVLAYFKQLGLEYQGSKLLRSKLGHCIPVSEDKLFCMDLDQQDEVQGVTLYIAKNARYLVVDAGLYLHNGTYIPGEVLEDQGELLQFRGQGSPTVEMIRRYPAIDKYILPHGEVVDLPDPPGTGQGGELNEQTVIFTQDEGDCRGLAYLGRESQQADGSAAASDGAIAAARRKLAVSAASRGAFLVLITDQVTGAGSQVTVSGRFFGIEKPGAGPE